WKAARRKPSSRWSDSRRRKSSATGITRWVVAAITAFTVMGFGVAGSLTAGDTDQTLSAALQGIYASGTPPTSIDDLRLMDQHQQSLVEAVTQVTVALQIGATRGSGVLVSQEGHVLTAAHVAGQAGLDARVITPNGRKLHGQTLGMNKGMDAALVKIDSRMREGKPVEWPYAKMGEATDLQPGSWCLALGHPGGYQPDRQPVARFGRVLTVGKSALTTDCKLVGGDSGGPLFDMEGRVIGVHSRIGSKVTKNVHVPVDTYRDDWARLVRGDSWGSLIDVVGRPVIGVLGEEGTEAAKIAAVLPASPAERAGIQPGDLVTQLGDHQVETFDDLKKFVNQRQPGDRITVEILRNGKKLELQVVLASIANR
ncbi:MAG: S1C family serine protease, partial [Planctomycetota bacterium]